MADPPTTPSTTVTTPDIVAPTDEQNQAWSTYSANVDQAGGSLGKTIDLSSQVKTAFDTVTSALSKAGVAFGNLGSMTPEMATKFGLLTSSIMGTRDAFAGIAGVDTSRLTTVMDQVTDLQEAFQNSEAYKIAQRTFNETTAAIMRNADKLGPTGVQAALKAASETFKTATSVVSDATIAFAKSADNATRLQNSMIQMTLAGGGAGKLFGDLGDTFGSAGSDLQHLDNTMKLYNTTLEKGSALLGGTKRAQETIAGYMATINKMPGTLTNLIKSTEIAGKTTDLLTGSLEIAAATGRREEDVLTDINQVLTSYKGIQDESNQTAGAAATLTARMGLLSHDLQADIKDVQGAMMGQVDAFKMFVGVGSDVSAMTQGMANAMSDYVSKLESVGVPAQNAIEMFKQYTGQLSQMTMGQKAFLLTMSGGAGGLRGGFQIDMMIKQGKFEELQKKVGDTIKKMTGPIVSLDEASKSESAAAQYQRQIMILQQGPLGAMAKTPQEAENLLAAMKEGKPVAQTKTPEERMQAMMKEGNKIQKDSHTVLVDIAQSVNTLALRASEANKATMRVVGGTGNLGPIAGGFNNQGAGISPGRGPTGAPIYGSEAFKQMEQVARNLPKTVQDSWASLKEAIKGGNQESIQKFNDRMMAAINDQKKNQSSLTEAQRTALTAANKLLTTPATRETTAPTTGLGTAPPTTQTTTIGPPGKERTLSFTPMDTYAPRGKQVGQVIPPATQAGVTTTGPGGRGGTTTTGPTHPMMDPNKPVPVTLAGGTAFTVTFTCPNCGTPSRQTAVSGTTSQGNNKQI